MPAGVTADIAVSIRASLAGAADLGTPQVPANVDFLQQFIAGTDTTSKADLMFADTRTLAASATENLDMAGVLTTGLGAVITAAEVVAIWVKAAATNTNNVVVGGAASNAFSGPFTGTTPKANLQPGNAMLFTCPQGWPVTAGTGDILLIANSGAGTGVDYDIVIIARTVVA